MKNEIVLTTKEDKQRKANDLAKRKQNFFDESKLTVTERQFKERSGYASNKDRKKLIQRGTGEKSIKGRG